VRVPSKNAQIWRQCRSVLSVIHAPSLLFTSAIVPEHFATVNDQQGMLETPIDFVYDLVPYRTMNFVTNTRNPPHRTIRSITKQGAEMKPLQTSHSAIPPIRPTKRVCRPRHGVPRFDMKIDQSSVYAEALEIHPSALSGGPCQAANQTPRSYAHGPRQETQEGPLNGYSAHAELLRREQEVLKSNIKHLQSKLATAWVGHQTAKRDLAQYLRTFPGRAHESTMAMERRLQREVNATKQRLHAVMREVDA
jgi:hypothetical protein